MNNVNIFEVAKEKKMPKWAQFKNAGDSIQGTYVGKITGTIDGFGNEQIVYQLLKDEEVYNVSFGLNKRSINDEMSKVVFGQIVGFIFKGILSIKNKVGVMVNVKDFGLFTDAKIVDKEWLKENASTGYVPEAIHVNTASIKNATEEETNKAFQEFSKFGASEASPVPSTDTPASITAEDKLAVIMKLAHDKLGVSDLEAKDKVMEITGIAFIVPNFDRIIASLNTIGV